MRHLEPPFELKVDKWTFRVPRDLYYIENDYWARVEGKIATLGITSYMQNKIGDLVFVSYPEIGAMVEQFGEAGSFESVKAVLDFISPVSGKVVEVNKELEAQPDLANTEPYDKGWFLKIELTDFESDRENLCDAAAYFEVMKANIEKERLKLKKKAESGS